MCFREVCGFFFPIAASQKGIFDHMLVEMGHQNFTAALTARPEAEEAASCCRHQTVQPEGGRPREHVPIALSASHSFSMPF